jgi:uncharacterized protein (TIGR03083 family)
MNTAATETIRMADALRKLDDTDWTKPTCCPPWDVRALAGHVLGMTETFTGLRRFVPDMIAGTRRAGKDRPQVDGMTEHQVERTKGLSQDELIDRLRAAAPKNAAWRASRRLMRRIPLKQEMRDGSKEPWKLSYIFDTILTRDTWMHRSDVAVATGHAMELTAEHDGQLVADVVAEWARRHGQPFTLTLTGPAGGVFTQGKGGEVIEIDAVEFCRILSGRGTGTGLLTQEVPF